MNYRNTANQIEDFAGMAENYNTTKPVVSKNHTREDNITQVGTYDKGVGKAVHDLGWLQCWRSEV